MRSHTAEVALYSFLSGAVGFSSIAQGDWVITVLVAAPLLAVAVVGVLLADKIAAEK